MNSADSRVVLVVKSGLIKIFIKFLLKNLFKVLPSRLLVQAIQPEKLQNLWFTQFFNGQIRRTEFIASCFRDIDFTDVIETGTYLGNSTIALSCLSSAKVHSIEINTEFFQYTKNRIQRDFKDRNIILYNGDSQLILEDLLRSLSPQTHILFLYLDAHWHDKLPLRTEVSLLNAWGGKFIAVIDDFQIQDDTGYGFDKYNNETVGLACIPELTNGKIFSLAAHSSEESGAKRGTGIIIENRLRAELSPTLLDLLKPIK